MLSIVSGSNGLWDYPMFAAHVRDHGYDLVLDPPVTYHAVWEKFPELLLIEAKFMAQLHDQLFHLVDAHELRYSVSGLHTASSYLEQCVVGYTVNSTPIVHALSRGLSPLPPHYRGRNSHAHVRPRSPTAHPRSAGVKMLG
jgi:hypothetical protein